MLADRYDVAFLRSHLLGRCQWRPFPPAADRAAWGGLLDSEVNRRRRDWAIAQAEALLDEEIPPLPASVYLQFVRQGNRTVYETPQRQRRQRLATFVLAECFEGEGRFLDAVLDTLWAICEESTWTAPAHLWRRAARKQATGNHLRLCPPDHHGLDLADGDTALLLAETVYLLGDALDAITPVFGQRVTAELERRIWRPAETRDDYFWCQGVNNWTPWVAGNVMGSAMYLMDDPQRLAELCHRMMRYADRYIAGYPADGGCDEGPGYWNLGPGALLMLLEFLHSRSNGAVSVYDQSLVHRMVRYPMLVNLAGGQFAAFADTKPVVTLRRAVLYRFAQRVGHAEAMNFALLAARAFDAGGDVCPLLQGGPVWAHLPDLLRDLWWMPSDTAPQPVRRPRDTWLGDLQVWVARQSETSDEGLVLAAKAGHNAENHNHNDVGQFILLLDGRPMIIDVGVGTYTALTFSERRYETWYINSAGHNVPIVDGVLQGAGRNFAARDVVYATPVADESSLTMDLAGAYEEAAGLERLQRQIVFRRPADGQPPRVTVTDQIERRDGKPAAVELCLHTPAAVQTPSPGVVTLQAPDAPRALSMEYDAGAWELSVEEVPLDDPTLCDAWGDSLRRLRLRLRQPASRATCPLSFGPV